MSTTWWKQVREVMVLNVGKIVFGMKNEFAHEKVECVHLSNVGRKTLAFPAEKESLRKNLDRNFTGLTPLGSVSLTLQSVDVRYFLFFFRYVYRFISRFQFTL